MSKANSKARRRQRYEAAVLRQISFVGKCKAGEISWSPAPVEEFLRRGDTVDYFLPDPDGNEDGA